MADEAWLQSSLRRSASLGLEVLERASRRSVDWTAGASQAATTPEEDTTKMKRTHSELDDVFGTIAGLMAEVTHQCKRFYDSGCCTDPSDTEKRHMSRFHSRPDVQSARKHGRPPLSKGRASAGEDFFVEVSPGTYAITASLPQIQQQTQLVSVTAGESIKLTFDL